MHYCTVVSRTMVRDQISNQEPTVQEQYLTILPRNFGELSKLWLLVAPHGASHRSGCGYVYVYEYRWSGHTFVQSCASYLIIINGYRGREFV